MRALSNITVLLALLLCTMPACQAQTTNCSAPTEFNVVPTGATIPPSGLSTVRCNSTAYASYVQWAFIEPSSSGNLSWSISSVAASNSSQQRNIVAGTIDGPISGNGNVSSCGYASVENGQVGDSYGLSLGCGVNQTGLAGQCTVHWNVSVLCLQGATSPSYSSSTAGLNAAAPTAAVGGAAWSVLLLLVGSLLAAMTG